MCTVCSYCLLYQCNVLDVLLPVLFSHQKSYRLRTVKKAQRGAWNLKRCVVLRHPQGSLHLQSLQYEHEYIATFIFKLTFMNRDGEITMTSLHFDNAIIKFPLLVCCQMFGLVWSRFKFIVLTGGGQTHHSSHYLLIHRESSHLLPVCKWGTKLEHINPSLNYIKCHWCDLTLTYTHMEGS